MDNDQSFPQSKERYDDIPAVRRVIDERSQVVFLYSGLSFLLFSIGLFAVAVYILYDLTRLGNSIADMLFSLRQQQIEGLSLPLVVLAALAPSTIITISGFVCILTEIRLLRAAGVTTREVIPSGDYEVISSALAQNNTQAISDYIRLSSLTGMTGTFTKIGLSGLPLATIFLTIILSVIGIFVPAFFDLAQLTLGAFIGSYVQKQRGDFAERG